jgi:hypothetical protein
VVQQQIGLTLPHDVEKDNTVCTIADFRELDTAK